RWGHAFCWTFTPRSRGTRHREVAGSGPFDWSDEPIATSVDRLNVGRRLGIVAERLPKETDRFGERRVGHEGVSPDAVDDLLTRHEIAGSCEQALENTEHSRWQRQLVRAAPEELAVRIEREGAERHDRPPGPFHGRRCALHSSHVFENSDGTAGLKGS